MATIDDVKIMLMITGTERDALLALIISNTEASLKLRVASKTVPAELTHVVVGVAVKRFNRLKNEGMTSYTQEGESITFNSQDFDEFADDIDAWLEQNAKPKSFGQARFISAYGRRP